MAAICRGVQIEKFYSNEYLMCAKCGGEGYPSMFYLYIHQQDCEKGETECAKAADEMHCTHWYDGLLCCLCQLHLIPDYNIVRETPNGAESTRLLTPEEWLEEEYQKIGKR